MFRYMLAWFNPQRERSWGVGLEWFTGKKHQGFFRLQGLGTYEEPPSFQRLVVGGDWNPFTMTLLLLGPMNCTVKEFNVWMIFEAYRIEPIFPRVRHMLCSTSFWWTRLTRFFLQVRSLTNGGIYLRLTRKSPSLVSGSDFTLKGRLTRPSLLDTWQNLLPRACINITFLFLL